MVCREVCEWPSNRRSTGRLDDLLADRNVPGICGIDTRALTRHLRDRGVMRRCLSAGALDASSLVDEARSARRMEGLALADLVTCGEAYGWNETGPGESADPADRERP